MIRRKHLGISGVIALLILVVVSVAGGVVVYNWVLLSLKGAQASAESQAKAFKELVAVEGCAVLKTKTSYIFKAYLRNVGSITAKVDAAYFYDEHGNAIRAMFFNPVELEPYELRSVTAGFPTQSGAPHSLVFKTQRAVPTTLQITSYMLEHAARVDVYLIDLTSQGVPGHWVNPTILRSYLEQYAYVEVVDSWSELDSLIRDPPTGVVVVNAHGELVPMPSTWSSWEDYFKKIGVNIRDYGWIWVSVKGYPFYYYYKEGEGKFTVGSSGVNRVLTPVAGQADFWSQSDGVTSTALTSTGVEASELVSLSLASQADTPRACRSVSGVMPVLIFYELEQGDKTYYGAASYKVGKGYLLVNGFSAGYSDDETAKAATAFAIYTKFYTMKVRGPVFNTPPTVYMLCLDSTHSHWIDKDEVADSSTWLAAYYDANVVLVSSYSSLEDLMLNPPSEVVVINTHGEAVPIPDSWVGDQGSNWRTVYFSQLTEIYGAQGSSSYTQSRPIDISKFPEGIKVQARVACLAPRWFAIGFTSSAGAPSLSEWGHRVVLVEFRETTPRFVVSFNNYQYESITGSEDASLLSWYTINLTVFSNSTVKVVIKGENGDQYTHTTSLKRSYSDINHVSIGVWGLSSGDASYLVSEVKIHNYSGGSWSCVESVSSSNWRSWWTVENDQADTPYTPRWRGYFAMITWHVKRYGWIWDNIIGYPYYYVVNVHYSGKPGWSTGDSDHEYSIGSSGASYVFELLGGNLITCFNSVECILTSTGRKAKDLFVEAAIPTHLPSSDVVRAQRFTGISFDRIKVFYDDVSGSIDLFGSCSIKYGKGHILFNGFAPNRLVEASKAATAFALYIYKIAFDQS